jgi:hypothetical protein
MSEIAQQKKFHITIGTLFELTRDRRADLNIDNEIRMVKAALLYADRIKLCSLSASVLDYFTALAYKPVSEQIELLDVILRRRHKYNFEIPSDDAKYITTIIKTHKIACRREQSRKNARMVRLRLEEMFQRSFPRDGWKQLANEIATKSGLNDIRNLVDLDLLEYHQLNYRLRKEDMEKLAEEFFAFVSKAVADDSTYPLFDNLTGELIRESITEGQIVVSETRTNRAKQSKLAALILERLPVFDEATFDEILDIRKELEQPLVRFRAAMISFSEKIKSAPWDQDFSSDAEQVFRKEVEPAVLDIEDAIKSNNYLAALGRTIYDKPLTLPAGSALAVAMSHLSSLPHLYSEAIGISAALASVISAVTKDWKEKQLKAEQNQLFFYYRARKDLTK